MHRSWLIVGWALAGCASAVNGPITGESSDGADVSMETSEAKSSSHESVSVRAASKPEAKTDGYVLGGADKRGVALGSPCPAKTESAEEGKRSREPEVCGTQGRVAIEVAPFGHIDRPESGKLPCEPAAIDNRPGGEAMSPYQASACVVDDFLIASNVCVMCRVMSGQAIHARVSELSADQRKYVMQILGLSGDPPADAAGFAKLLASKHLPDPRPGAKAL